MIGVKRWLPWCVFLIFLLFSQLSWAQWRKKMVTLSCKHIAPIERSYLSRHINFRQKTVNLERRVIDEFIKRIDGSKIYLYQSDVNRIKNNMKGFFGKVKTRDCSQIEAAYKQLILRADERVKFAKSYLGPRFKLLKNTQVVLDPKHREYPKNKRQADNFHRKYLQFQVANYLATDMELAEAKGNVSRSYDRVALRTKKILKPKYKSDLWALYLDAFSRALDPHSAHLSQEELETFEIHMALSLEGIGATLSSQDGFTVIEQLIPGGAAARSGKLRPKDKILAVGQGANGALENVVEEELRHVVKKIRGKKGSQVRLSILRKTGKKVDRFIVTLVRDKIKLEDEAASMEYIKKKVGQHERVVGLLNLPSFYTDGRRRGRSSAKDLKRMLAEAKTKKVDGIVLDLSTNGGGALEEAVQIAGLFIKEGFIVTQSHRDPSRGDIVLRDKDKSVDYAGPLVILTSRLSASASEIVAGALKDYKRAVIVGGDHTFGKGSVQSVEPLPVGLGAIKTTVGMFFTVGGASTQHRGVTADIPFPSTYSIDEFGEMGLDYSLPPKRIAKFLSPQAYVSKGPGTWKMVDSSLVKLLSKKSAKRIKDSKDFDKIRENITKMKDRGKVVKISEILDGDSDESEEDKSQTVTGILSPEEKKKRYLKRADIQEAINVMVDYIKIHDKQTVKVGRLPQK